MPKSSKHADPPRGNLLLDAAGAATIARLGPALETLDAELKTVLHEPGVEIEHVYFPLSGIASMVKELEDGTIIEVATVGNEGMVGLPVFLGVRTSPVRVFIQVPGTLLRIEAERLRVVLAEDPRFSERLNRYTQALFGQVAQVAACNRAHTLEERAARWFLMSRDRVGSDEFLLPTEFLGQMLGVRRPSVHLAVRALQNAGLLRYAGNTVTIVDREGLEQASCDCYGEIRAEYERLLA